jgi:beta-N-acetylhexosaminidase
MSLGPLMIDVAGTELSQLERERLQHPQVGGVILFSRNFESPEQLAALVADIHRLREPQLLVAVDQEGGRVQRFREGFTRLPPVRRLGAVYEENRKRALRLAEEAGWLMAAELRSVGVDMSFAPVLDLDLGVSEVIGDRAFHSDVEVVSDLAHVYMLGMRRAGMVATGKHFPGHGSVAPDSHKALPVDERELEDVRLVDMVPFERLSHYGIAAFMTAHIVYPQIDSQPVSFSRFWLQGVLRQDIGFQGAIFSDDLSMAGAHVMGSMPERARMAVAAGCDMVLVCNDADDAEAVLDAGVPHEDPASHLRLARLHGRHAIDRQELLASVEYRQAYDMLYKLG